MLDKQVKETLKDAARKLSGSKKRAFMAKVAEDYFDASARKAETYLGWGWQTVQLGLHERESGVVCVDYYQGRGNHRSEAKQPELEQDIRALVDSQSQADPTFRTTFYYARVSAQSVRDALIEEKGYRDEDLPTRKTSEAA